MDTERPVRLTYDDEARAAYVYIAPGEAVRTCATDATLDGSNVILDFDADDRLLGVEILGADRLLRPETLAAAAAAPRPNLRSWTEITLSEDGPELDPSTVTSRETLAAFIRDLHAELRREGYKAWENPTLGRYLEALSAVTDDMGGWFTNEGLPFVTEPSWQLLAEMLLAATLYE